MTSPKTGRPLSSAGDLSGVPAPEFALVLVRARWRRDLVPSVCLRAAARPGPPAPPPPQGFVAAVASLIPVSRPLFSAGSSGYVVDPSVRVTILCGWIERKPGIPGERTAFWKPENEGPTAARTAWHHTLLRLPVLARALFQRARGAQTVCDNIVLGISHTPDLCNQNTWLPRVVASCVFVSFPFVRQAYYAWQFALVQDWLCGSAGPSPSCCAQWIGLTIADESVYLSKVRRSPHPRASTWSLCAQVLGVAAAVRLQL